MLVIGNIRVDFEDFFCKNNTNLMRYTNTKLLAFIREGNYNFFLVTSYNVSILVRRVSKKFDNSWQMKDIKREKGVNLGTLNQKEEEKILINTPYRGTVNPIGIHFPT
jgi:hypothetical protein